MTTIASLLQRIRAFQETAKKATPGKWQSVFEPPVRGSYRLESVGPSEGWPIPIIVAITAGTPESREQANFEHIATMHNDLPSLLDEVQAVLTKEIECPRCYGTGRTSTYEESFGCMLCGALDEWGTGTGRVTLARLMEGT